MNNKINAFLLAALMFDAAATAQDPENIPEGSYLSIHGTVVNATADSFDLRYGDDLIAVEMEHWDWYSDIYDSLDGKEVRVYGYLNEPFYKGQTIRATSIHVEDIGTYFYPSGIHDEPPAPTAFSVHDFDFAVTGEVTAAGRDKFTLDSGERQLTVDIRGLDDNPLDDEGFQKVVIGDRVTVFADSNPSLFLKRTVRAEAVIKLQEDSMGNADIPDQ